MLKYSVSMQKLSSLNIYESVVIYKIISLYKYMWCYFSKKNKNHLKEPKKLFLLP